MTPVLGWHRGGRQSLGSPVRRGAAPEAAGRPCPSPLVLVATGTGQGGESPWGPNSPWPALDRALTWWPCHLPPAFLF